MHHSDYESNADDMISSHALPSGMVPAPKNAYDATLQLARSITFGEGSVRSNVWMDANYNWSDGAGFALSASRSLDLAILAVASAIDGLVTEATSTPPPDTPPPSDDTAPPDDTIPPGDEPNPTDRSLANAAVVGLTVAAVLAVSGVLLVRTRRTR